MNEVMPFLWSACCILVYAAICFLVSLVKRRNDIADVAWGPGFIVVAGVSLLTGGVFAWRSILLSVLVLIWALRLFLHLCARNNGRGEDARYRQWRESWGRWFVLRSFLQVFLLQGGFLLLVAFPVMWANTRPPTPFAWLDLLGLMVWLTGFFFETVGDAQLLVFKRKPENRGKLMTAGLWRYTRHPNYFGEATLWWGLWLIVCAFPYGWQTFIGPLTLTLLLLKVSGIPMLERHYAGRADFAAYKRRTSAFLPLPQRKRSGP